MIPYLFPLYFLCISVVLSLIVDKKANFVFLVIFMPFVIFFAGFRFHSDTDYLAYINIFNSLPKLERVSFDVFINTYGEPGYLLMNIIIKTVGLPFFFVTLIASFISLGAKAYFAMKFSHSAFLVISLYLCMHFVTTEFSELRWSIATGLLILAIHYRYLDKIFKGFILFLLSVFFHYSSILVILIVMLAKYFNKSRVLILFSLSFLLALAFKFFPASINLQFESDIFILARLQRYVNNIDSNVGFISLSKSLFYIILIMTASFIKHRSIKAYFSNKADDFEIVFFLLISVSLCLSFVPIFFLRLAPLVDFFAIIVIFNLVDSLKKKNTRFLLKCICIFFFGLWFVISLPRSLDVPLTDGGLGEYFTVLKTLI